MTGTLARSLEFLREADKLKAVVRRSRLSFDPERRENDAERIFSMNMGIAVDDMVTAKVLYERALERGVGVRLPL